MTEKYTLALSYTLDWWKRTLPTNSPEWRKLRLVILNRDKWTCRFCGIKLSKYMVVDHIDGNATNNDLSNLRLNCPACDRIRHCGLAEIQGMIRVYYTAGYLTQLEIIQLTHQFYLKNHRNPKAKEIDLTATLAPVSLTALELAEIPRQQSLGIDVPIHLSTARAFFTRRMNFSYLKWIILN